MFRYVASAIALSLSVSVARAEGERPFPENYREGAGTTMQVTCPPGGRLVLEGYQRSDYGAIMIFRTKEATAYIVRGVNGVGRLYLTMPDTPDMYTEVLQPPLLEKALRGDREANTLLQKGPAAAVSLGCSIDSHMTPEKLPSVEAPAGEQ